MFNHWICRKIKGLFTYIFSKENVFIVDTPEHGNLGDHAIALAERNIIRELNLSCGEITGRDLSNIECIYGFFSKLKKDDVYLYTGGGFLGSLWMNEEYMFRKFLRNYRNKKIIVFPQTISFDLNSENGRKVFEESKIIYESHEKLIFFVREKKTFEFMNKYMPNVKVYLVPDIVLSLDVKSLLDFRHNDRKRVALLCFRDDLESILKSETKDSITKSVENELSDYKVKSFTTVTGETIFKEDRKKALRDCLAEISEAGLMVTDRLHGMIFAAITGTPCIAFSNCNGKVDGVYEWISMLPYVKLVRDLTEFEIVLNNLDLNINYKFSRDQIMEQYSLLIEELKLVAGENN